MNPQLTYQQKRRDPRTGLSDGNLRTGSESSGFETLPTEPHKIYLNGCYALYDYLANQGRNIPRAMKTKRATNLSNPPDHYGEIARTLTANPRVTVGAGQQKGFGADALRINRKIFAMLSSRNCFVVKLPKPRVDELVVAGKGHRFDPGHGRLMKEWFEFGPGLEHEWLPLAQEACRFVGAAS